MRRLPRPDRMKVRKTNYEKLKESLGLGAKPQEPAHQKSQQEIAKTKGGVTEVSTAMITSVPKAPAQQKEPVPQQWKRAAEKPKPKAEPSVVYQKFRGIKYSIDGEWVKLQFPRGEKRRTKITQFKDGRKFCVLPQRGNGPLYTVRIEGNKLTKIVSTFKSKRWKK